MTENHEFTLALTTAGSRSEAESIARSLVEQRLAACVNITGPVTSVYQWDGKIRKEEERILIMKTRTALIPSVRKAVLEMHSYDCPEIIEIPVTGGFEPYLGWIRKETAGVD